MFESRVILVETRVTISLNWGGRKSGKNWKKDGWKEIKLQGLYAGKSDLEIEMLDLLEDECAVKRTSHFT